MKAPQRPATRSLEPIATSTWVALALLASGWFGLATFVTAFGPVKQIVHFYELATVLQDPSWLAHGFGSHSLEAFAFGTLSVAVLLAPLAAHRLGTRSSWLLYLLPLSLMVSCGLILYHEVSQPYVSALQNAGAVGAFVSRFANEVVGGAADTIARHISLGTGSYVSFAAALYLTRTGVRGYLATSDSGSLFANRAVALMNTRVRCSCGSVQMQISGEPMMQYFCHCDDCQAVHGKAYPISLYPAPAVSVVSGETVVFTLRTSPRTRCKQCGTYLFAEVPGHAVRGLNANLLPEGLFKPEFHIQCRYAVVPIEDDLPHYKGTPARFNGSDELMQW